MAIRPYIGINVGARLSRPLDSPIKSENDRHELPLTPSLIKRGKRHSRRGRSKSCPDISGPGF